MADIIPLDEKIKLSNTKKAAIIKKQKIQAVQKAFQCTRCAVKCEKCGAPIRGDQHGKASDVYKLSPPYHFCGSCEDEYKDYIERLKGRGDPDCYWHNDSWVEGWRAWIEYQGAIDSYLKSKEFIRLLQEIKANGPA